MRRHKVDGLLAMPRAPERTTLSRPIADLRDIYNDSRMSIFSRAVQWIDRGYDNGVATSNLVLGLIIALIGLMALSVGSPTIRWAAFGLAGVLAALFGWRMLLSFRRLVEATGRRKNRKR
jgi:hypothetical protein